MIDTFNNLEKEILEYCYSTILYLGDYYHNFTIEELLEDRRFEGILENEIQYWIEQLISVNHITVRTFLDKWDFQISLEGLLFLEKFYMKENQEFISFTIDVLDFLKKVENKIIKLDPEEGAQVGSFPIPEFLNILECIEEVEQKKLEFVIHEISGRTFHKGGSFVYSNSFGFGGKKLIFFRTLLLTSKGRKFLSYHQKLKNLFNSLNDEFAKEVILDEYNEVENLRKREKWKDAIIKIGTILEYLITNYIESEINQVLGNLDNAKKSILDGFEAQFHLSPGFIEDIFDASPNAYLEMHLEGKFR
ncbi:hypothetical protein LCGC14_3025790, partial [marine sediment metagenome]